MAFCFFLCGIRPLSTLLIILTLVFVPFTICTNVGVFTRVLNAAFGIFVIIIQTKVFFNALAVEAYTLDAIRKLLMLSASSNIVPTLNAIVATLTYGCGEELLIIIWCFNALLINLFQMAIFTQQKNDDPCGVMINGILCKTTQTKHAHEAFANPSFFSLTQKLNNPPAYSAKYPNL